LTPPETAEAGRFTALPVLPLAEDFPPSFPSLDFEPSFFVPPVEEPVTDGSFSLGPEGAGLKRAAPFDWAEDLSGGIVNPAGVRVGDRGVAVAVAVVAVGESGVELLGDASLEAARFGEVGWWTIGLEEVALDVEEVEGPASGVWLLDVAGFEGENIESEGPKESRKEIPIGSERSAFFFAVSSNSAGLPPYTHNPM
jgi:hypothetical protein